MTLRLLYAIDLRMKVVARKHILKKRKLMLMAVRALGMDSKASWFQPEDGDSPLMHVLPHNRSCRFCKGGYVCMQIICTD